MWSRLLIGVAWLAFQLAAVVYARFVPSRYFCWAPYDMQTEYWVDVSVGGRQLSPAEIRDRYKRPAHGFDNRSVRHVIDMFEQTEHRYHGADPAVIRMRYNVNGHIDGEWSFPASRKPE
jgi:hypothetical protein